MTDIFEGLESNDKETVENVKQSLREQFIKVTDPWLLNGLYDYYLSTNSVGSLELLVVVTEPHHLVLFDRISDTLKGLRPGTKVQALTLLGHMIRAHPTWLYKLPDHVLLKDILKLLKTEVELLPLISALLFIIVLLPMVPAGMGYYLKDLFEIFSRLAAWSCSALKFVEEQHVHMQVALYALFLRLYGMYPCNFLDFLRAQYKEKNNPVFLHTIKPLLNTVRMHPSLISTSKEYETSTERWMTMGVHNVIVECERLTLDLAEICPHESCQYSTGFRSRSGTSNSNIEASIHLQNLKSLASLQMSSSETNFFSPSMVFKIQTSPITESAPTDIPHVQGASTSFASQEGSSPPEAAIEATPETTPLRDFRAVFTRSQPLNSSNIVRALTSFSNKNRVSGSHNTTPTHSQPSSPMRKETSPFNFASDSKTDSAFSKTKRDSVSSQKFSKLILERSQIGESSSSSDNFPSKNIPMSSKHTSKNIPTPSSPLRIISSETVSRQFSSHQRNESPISKEDEEIVSIIGKNEAIKQPAARSYDSVMPDFIGYSNKNLDQDEEQGSPCTAGGLHMPNSKSMMDFTKKIQRFRYHSQCNPETEKIETSTGSSPGNNIPFPNNTTVRRANSCPEMKKSSVISTKDNISKPLDEADEEATGERKTEAVLNSSNAGDRSDNLPKSTKSFATTTTQTENFWPMPYEHLFLGIFPSLESSSDVKPSPAPSPAPFFREKVSTSSLYDILDKYIESALTSSDKNSLQFFKDELALSHQHLLFERHRRETHAYRNRRLLADAKSTRLLEECNSALRDTVQLQQKDLDDLRKQQNIFQKNRLAEDKKLNNTIQYWEKQCKILNQECRTLKEANDNLTKDLSEVRTKCASLDSERQQAEAALLDALVEVNVTREQARAGEKGRHELEQANKELILIGELQIKYQEKLDELSSMKRSEQELQHVKEAYKNEVKALNQHVENNVVTLEAYRSRILELEHKIMANEELVTSQKRILSGVNEQHHEKLQAVESKYQTQLTINRALEEKLLDVRQHLEFEKSKKAGHSPDTSSCHEVHVTTTAGISPHSSPLSASLASSDGSTAFHEREVKNLQAIVDQKEIAMKSKLEESGEVFVDNEGPQTSSAKND